MNNQPDDSLSTYCQIDRDQSEITLQYECGPIRNNVTKRPYSNQKWGDKASVEASCLTYSYYMWFRFYPGHRGTYNPVCHL